MSAIEKLAIICVSFVGDESGATAIEYGLMVALLAVAGLIGFAALGVSVRDMHTSNASLIMNAFNGS